MSSCPTSWRARARALLLGLAAVICTLGLTVAGLPAASAGPAAGSPGTVCDTGSKGGPGCAGSRRSLAPAPVKLKAPKLVGKAVVGSRVKLDMGLWENTASVEGVFVDWTIDGEFYDSGEAYLPERGEDPYASSLVVPAKAAGHRLGARISLVVAAGVEEGGDTGDIVLTPLKVSPAKFAKTAVPVISGSARVASTLRVKAGTWSPTASIRYQWLRNGRAIKGATRSSYKATAADYKQRIAVRATATRAGYTQQSRTSRTVKIGSGSFAKTRAPKLSGSAIAGKRLSAKVGGWSPKAKFSYQWLRGGKAVRGAKRSTYKLTVADIGKRVAVRVTGRSKGYRNATRTSGSKKVGAYRFVVKKRPTISGSHKAGAKLSAKRLLVSPKASRYSYRWLRNGKAIRGATRSTFKVRSGDKGARISVRVTALRKHYKTVSSTSKAVKIHKPAKKRSWAYPDDWGECPASHPVKGNQSGIYHVPGGRWYDVTTAEECFSSAGAAEAAGYRASLNG